MSLKDITGRKSEDSATFFLKVYKQLQSSDFSCIMDARDAIMFNPKLKSELLAFLKKNITIKDNLEVVSNFDIMSETAKFNFVTLLCILQIPVPQEFLQTDILRLLHASYTQPPKMPIPPHIAEEVVQKPPEPEKPPEITSAPMTKEFFNEIEDAILKYPQFAEQIILEKFDSSGLKQFHDTVKLFFSCDRSSNAVSCVFRYFILPYIKNLTSLARRLAVDPLIEVSQTYPRLVITEILQPLLFDPKSSVFQFQVMQRLCECKNLQAIALPGVFEGQSPSIQGPLSDDAINWLSVISSKTPQLSSEEQEHLLLHIKAQLHHQSPKAAQFFMNFLKSQRIEGTNRDIALEMTEGLPEVMKLYATKLIQ